MSRAFGSLLPSASLAAQGEESKQPRKVFQPETLENKEQSASDLDNDSGSMNVSGIPVQSGSSGPPSLVKVQEGYGAQGTKQTEFPDDEERIQPMFSTPETIHYSLESDADSETIDSGGRRTDHTITYVTTTATKIKERRSRDVQEAERSATAREGSLQSRKVASTSPSRTTAGQQQYDTRSSAQGGGQRKASFYQETRHPRITESGQSPVIFSSASKAVETRRFMVPSKSTYSSVREQFLQIERLHREEKDRIVTLMSEEHEKYRRSCEEQFQAFQLENERLLRDISAAVSRITSLELQLNSRVDGYPGTASQPDKVYSTITTITSTIATIATTIATVTTRIEQWKHTVATKKGQITISSKELEQLSLDLSSVSSQMIELQQHYAGLSRDFSSIYLELQVISSRSDEKDRTIASLTVEVAEWKNADAANAQHLSSRDDTTTTTEVEEMTTTDVQEAEQSETASEGTIQPRQDGPSFSQTIASQQQHEEQFSVQDEAQSKDTSLYQETYLPTTTVTVQHPAIFSSASTAVETRPLMVPSKSTYSAVRERFLQMRQQFFQAQRQLSRIQEQPFRIREKILQIEDLHREEQDRIVALMSEAHEDYKRSCEEQLEAFQMQNEELLREIQVKMSLLEENEYTISSLTTEVAQAKREDSMRVEQVATARRDVEQLRRELSSASSRIVDLQKRYEVQSKELNAVRDELYQIEILYPGGTNQAQGEPSKHAISQQIARALEKKNKQMEELRRDLTASNTRNTKLQKSYEELSREVSTVRDELKVNTSQNESTVSSLTTQVNQWRRADATKAERIATILNEVKKLQQDLSTSMSQLTELQGRYETQSREFIALRNDFRNGGLSNEAKDRTITSLTAEVDQWKGAVANKAEEIATTLKHVEKLQQDSSASTSKLAELQGRYESQSRKLVSVREELRTKTLLHEDKDHNIASLTATLDQWKHADATKAEQIATTSKYVEKLQRGLSTSASKLAELQGRHEAQSRELTSVRNELQTRISSCEDKDLTVAALTEQIEEWKRTDTLKEERILTIRKQAEDLRWDLTNSSSQITQLQQRYDMQSKELSSLRGQLQDGVSGKDRAVAALISKVKELERSDATKAEELTIVHNDLAQLRRNLATSTSQLAELQQRYETRSTELTSQVEGWKCSDATKTEELTAARTDMEKLRLDLSRSSSQIIEYRQRCAAQSAQSVELTSQIGQWKRSDAAKAEELATTHEKFEQLQHDLSTSSSRIIELQQRYEAQSTELNSLREQHHATSSRLGGDYTVTTLNTQIEQWKLADAAKAEELARARTNVEHPQRDLTSFSKHQFQPDNVQRFVTTADKYADTMIIQMLYKLNAEVQQSTTFMAEYMVEDFRPRAAKLTKEQTSAVQRVSESIGQPLAGCFGRMERDDVVLYLQIAFQAYIMYYLHSLISSWTTEKAYNDLINKTYEQLRRSEGQAISGRWRSLTRTYITPACMSDPKIVISNAVSGLSDIVMAAGCAPSPSAAKSKVSSQFGDNASSIISIAGQFSRMIAEVVSADFEVFTVRPLQMFEESSMEEDADHYDMAGGTATSQRVLCSTQLGMTKQMQLESGESDTLTVVKAKVVFESFLDA